MSKLVILVAGVPGVGKSKACEALAGAYEYVRHDDYMDGGYIDAIVAASAATDRPILAETPFSISQIQKPLEQAGFEVELIVIVAHESELLERWDQRSPSPSAKDRAGHLSRQRTYMARAEELGAFVGTSDAVIAHLREREAA